ncbi:MAG: hypothetical protein CMJ78_04170 [Planctomycetaceae bacterium]|nr:hypothetical protein [Planctomycetaceae bacterium]
MSQASTSTDRVICHCLGVTKSQIEDAARFGGCDTVREIKNCTTAGGGCTACHGRIKKILAAAKNQEFEPVASNLD